MRCTFQELIDVNSLACKMCLLNATKAEIWIPSQDTIFSPVICKKKIKLLVGGEETQLLGNLVREKQVRKDKLYFIAHSWHLPNKYGIAEIIKTKRISRTTYPALQELNSLSMPPQLRALEKKYFLQVRKAQSRGDQSRP